MNKPVEFDVKMLEFLVCPITYGALKFDKEKNELISVRRKLAFPIKNGIPIMLENEARVIEG